MSPVLKNKQAEIDTLCRQYQVKSLFAFGSVTDAMLFNENSDIDLLVEFKDLPVLDYADNYFELLFSLEQVFNRKVDLVTLKSLKNPVFIKVLKRTRVPVFEA